MSTAYEKRRSFTCRGMWPGPLRTGAGRTTCSSPSMAQKCDDHGSCWPSARISTIICLRTPRRNRSSTERRRTRRRKRISACANRAPVRRNLSVSGSATKNRALSASIIAVRLGRSGRSKGCGQMSTRGGVRMAGECFRTLAKENAPERFAVMGRLILAVRPVNLFEVMACSRKTVACLTRGMSPLRTSEQGDQRAAEQGLSGSRSASERPF